MIKTVFLFLFIMLSGHILFAQEKPTDIVNQLPDYFSNICSATNDEVETYSEYLGAFADKVHKSLDLLSDLEEKAHKTVKTNPNANVKALQQEYVKAEKALNISRDFRNEFSKAMDPTEEIKSRFEMIGKQMEETSDWQKIEQLGNELLKVKAEYCESTYPGLMEILVEQRAMLKANTNQLVIKCDLEQRINCELLGYTYFPELSYQEAYFLIIDHLDNMGMLINLATGKE